MPDLAIPLPCRRPELVAQPLGHNGAYLVRDRLKGESFTLGREEHFLLARLDGSHTAEDLRAAFAQRFGQPLATEELEDFLELARERGFLQPEGMAVPIPCGANGFEGVHAHLQPGRATGAGFPQRPGRLKRLAGRILGVLADLLRWFAGLVGRGENKVRWIKLARLDFVPRADDIFIVTYPRSGTTWMQMILYQLTTDGSMDFPHIYEYCPWFENSARSAGGFAGRPSPRLFKSHQSYSALPKGPCKYIYVARDGKDVAVSYYHLYQSHKGYQGTFTEFLDLFLRGKVDCGSWFQHVKGWWRHRDDPNVLFLRYEDLLADLDGCLRKIIALAGFDIAPERFPVILQRCSFAFMKQHESQFDSHTGQMWEHGWRLNAFLRQGRVGEGKAHLSPQQAARFDRVFHQQLGETEIPFVGNGRKLH